MSEKKCCSCMPESSEHNSNVIPSEEAEPPFDAVRRIWKEKMNQSQHFLPIEIDDILTVWIKFIRNLLKYIPQADADEFYVEAAEVAARKFQHFNRHGWDCLNMEFQIDENICSQESLVVPADLADNGLKTTIEVPSTSSAESISDALAQVEFLIKLVASSLVLVKTALELSFTPSYIHMKYPHTFSMAKTYLELTTEQAENPQTLTNLLNGAYDEYILPLQIANEVDEEFWEEFDI